MEGDYAVVAEELTKYYGDLLAVDHIDLRVARGEIFGLLGPNGAGKTTTVRMLTGILEPSEGAAWVLGYDMRREKLRARERMGIVPETANPYIDLTAMQNLRLVGSLYDVRKEDVERRGRELLELFGLWKRRDQKVRGFSKGMRQRLSVAMALLPDPEILFLDEPTSGLDVISARLIKEILREENREGKTIFMTTHNLHEANELCTRIAVINRGRIIAVDTPERLRRMSARHHLVVVSLDPRKPVDDALTHYHKIEYLGDKVRIHTDNVDRTVKELAKYAEENGLRIVYLSTEMPSLEDVFVHLVEENSK